MIILTTSSTQTFPIIPINQVDLSGNNIRLEFTNETTKGLVAKTATTRTLTNDIYYVGSNDLSFLKENTFYNLTVISTPFPLTVDNTNIKVDNNILTVDMTKFSGQDFLIYKDKIFCTNQSQSSYSINNGEYTSPNIDNNSYITI